MSTGLITKKSPHLNRFAELARLGEVVFHTDDLANLWRITNKNTLYTTIKRYVEQGLLLRIHKGFYAIKEPRAIDPLLLGVKALHGYAYVSTETILARAGIMQQAFPAITLVSGKAARFTVAGNAYYSRKLPDTFLYQSHGIALTPQGILMASLERAVADLLYFNARTYFDASQHIDWGKVRMIQKAIGYPITTSSHV